MRRAEHPLLLDGTEPTIRADADRFRTPQNLDHWEEEEAADIMAVRPQDEADDDDDEEEEQGGLEAFWGPGQK